MPYNWATWQAAVECSTGATPGARALMKWILANVEGSRSMGVFNCRQVRGGGILSMHAEGRALDVGMPMSGGKGSAAGRDLVRLLGAHGGRLGVQAAIYDRRIYSAKSPAGRPYHGVNPHYDHAHIELTRKAGARLTLATIRHVLEVPKAGGLDLRRGDRGPAVVALQKALHVKADGIFGERTEMALNAVKRKLKLPVDGVAGPAVRKALGL